MSASIAKAPARRYGCAAPARRLPWALAAATLVAALILAARVDPAGEQAGSRVMQGLLLAVAAVVGVRIVRSLRDLRLAVEVRDGDLLLELGGRTVSLPWDDVARLDWDPPFRHYGRWSPALVVVDRRARRYRIPALVAGGQRLVSDVLEGSGRADLAAWASAYRLAARMSRANVWTVTGYSAAACLLVAAATAPIR